MLELMPASAKHSPALSHADLAERAAGDPGRADALLDTSAALPGAERLPALAELRTALVNSGGIGAARV
ncbi:hypothetical protein [Streptomyces longwoodensis]|uniref:hypothetical protein n=1 Tax=Streptomyces longwoodensis TaxID=68231 RepID=UPI0036E818EA